MASDLTSGWHPDWAVPPGDVLTEALQDRGMTQAELANRMARPPKTINEIIKGKAAITPDTAIQLERALGISAGFWSGLESRYRAHLARQTAERLLETYAGWVQGFPLPDMVRYGLIRQTKSKVEALSELLSFFRVSGPEAFDRHWLDPAAAFRSSPAFMASPKSVAAWLRWGEIEATKVAGLPDLDTKRFRQVLVEVRALSRREPFAQTLQRVQQLCAEAGVVVALTPGFRGTHLSGATRWIRGHPLIQLSLRHKSDDQFWFTFFHEAGHVLTPTRHRDFVDAGIHGESDASDADEEAANSFARDLLIPPEAYSHLVALGDFSPPTITAFAQEQRIPAGVVVGRLQRDNAVSRASHLNRLKKTIHWPSN
jgi:addiction module HigA family antidote